MYVLLDHLRGPLELGVVVPLDTEGLIDVSFSAPSFDRSRVFFEDAARIQSEWPVDVVFAPAVAERITALRLAAGLAYLVPLFAELPAATALKVEIGSADDLDGPPKTRFPCLG